MVYFRPEPVQFESSGGICRGMLFLPSAARNAPAVVMCAGFAGTQGTPTIRAAADAFCGAGFAVLTFDYRRFGISDGEPRQVLDLADERRDIESALDFMARHSATDAARIALWGTSLGGGHVVVVAAGRRDVAAVIAQVPFNGFPRRVQGRSPPAVLRLLAAMVIDQVRGLLGRPPHYIPAVGAPGTTAVMASPAAQHAVASLDNGDWVNLVAPRVLLAMMRYRPGASAGHVTAPLLVCAATLDSETPAASVAEIAHRAPKGRLRSYPVAHFDVYRPDVRDQLITDQLAFLTEVMR